jgi:integrase
MYKTHDLRHYAASALIPGGASVKQVQMILGHASAAVTLGVYAHLWPGDDDRARGILDAALADCVRTPAVGE